MKQLLKEGKKHYKIAILLLIFAFSVLLRISTLNQIGRTWDEFVYVNEGYTYFELLKAKDFDNSFFYVTYDHPPLVKYLYGIPAYLDIKNIDENKSIHDFDLFNSRQFLKSQYEIKGYSYTEKISIIQRSFNYDLTYTRLLSVIMFSLGVVIVVLIGWKIFSPIVGIISGIILSMLPFPLGLSQLVATESLKILIYPLTIFVYILLIEKFSIKKIIIAGVVTGLALQAKQTNVFLILLLCIVFFVQYKNLKIKDRKIFIKARIVALVTITIISILVFILIWPQVIFHFKDVLAINHELWKVKFSLKPWQITLSPPEIFFGKLILTPVFYYVVYFFITIPIIILFLFFQGLNYVLRAKNIYFFIIILWFLLPFSMSFYSLRQHGLRYIIEIYPAIALIAALGFNQLLNKITKNEYKKLLYFIPIVIYLFVILWQIKPYYLDYFNELVGGTNNVYAHRLFQQGWWGQGEKEAGLYLRDHALVGSTIGLALSPEHTLPRFEKFTYLEWKSKEKYDYVVVNYYHIIRDGFDDSAIRKDYKLVYEVKADKATLVFIYKRK